MKTAISVPDDLFRRAEYAARKQGLSRSELYARALQAYLGDRPDRITEALDKLYARQSSVDPVIERAALSDLPKEQW
jgi:metal-responsive CopG/Arc/MetJ family transcriptional regulator